jgi:shikimate 5-dehydrogenase
MRKKNRMIEHFPVMYKDRPTFYFIGVTTTKSSIMKVFPLWMDVLQRPEVVIEGVDLKIHDTREAYRNATAQVKYDPLSLGALVTTHKVDLYNAAGDMFDLLDENARICGELSSISKRDAHLEGHAKDPISAGLSMDAILGPGYFGATGGRLLIFGAGGSAAATLLHLMRKAERADRPEQVILVNRSQGRLDSVRAMVESFGTGMRVDYICSSDPLQNDAVMAGLPEGSLVINATGMGKDTPGSPVTWAGQFPRHGIAWEFNYRGELDFLHQAEAQSKTRGVRVEDGWLYFVHGWTQVVAQVLSIDLQPEIFQKLEAAAASVRK